MTLAEDYVERPCDRGLRGLRPGCRSWNGAKGGEERGKAERERGKGEKGLLLEEGKERR